MKNRICFVLLDKQAYNLFDKVLEPFTKTGPVGNYIHCTSVEQQGPFIEMVFSPEMYESSDNGEIRISIPVNFVLLIVHSDEKPPIGFS